IEALPDGVTYEGSVYRFVDPQYVGNAWDIHAGNLAASHRYSSVGRGALYTATSVDGMAAEAAHYGRTMSNISTVGTKVSVSNILDLTNPAVMQQLGVTL